MSYESAPILHPSTEDAKERKHQLRQFQGLIELLYGESYASDLDHSVSVLRREVPLDVLTRSDSQIPADLRFLLEAIKSTAA